MQMVNAAKLENRRKTAASKRTPSASVFDAAAEKLAKYRDDAGYSQTFRSLLDEAARRCDGSVEVVVDPRDRALAEAA